MSSKNTTKYVDKLQDFIKNYYNNFHRTIKTTLHNIYKKNDTPGNETITIKNDIKIGDKVRILNPKTKFARTLDEKYSRLVYAIANFEGKNTYTLKNPKGNILKKKYEDNQLLKVNNIENPLSDKSEIYKVRKKEKQNRFLNKEGIEMNMKRNEK